MSLGNHQAYDAASTETEPRQIAETPPEWWDDYPFDSTEPCRESIGNGDALQRPSVEIVGPLCVPIPISEIAELHYIAPIRNLESILMNGILSHNRARPRNPVSIANADVNQRRATREFVPGRTVHDYVNLYFNARNPMLYGRLEDLKDGTISERFCVVMVAHTVLWLTNVLILDGNAANCRTVHTIPRDSTIMLDKGKVFARSWDSSSPAQKRENTRCIMAEALIPNLVSPVFLKKVYFRNNADRSRVEGVANLIPSQIHSDLFFNK